MGFYSRNRFEFMDDAVSDFVKLPDFLDAVSDNRRFAFEFFAEGPLVPERGKQVVEHFVVPHDAFVGGLSFETGNFVPQLFGILRFEADAFFRSKKHEQRSEENGYRDDEEDGEFGHAPRIPPLA